MIGQRFKLLLGLLLLLALLSACSSDSRQTNQNEAGAAARIRNEQPVAEGQLNIVATIGQVQDVAQNIVGEQGTVQLLMGEGVDPHRYVPVESDLVAFQQADIILYSGLNLEAQMIDIIEQIGRDRGVPVAAVTEAIPAELVVDEVGVPGTADPHIWGDVNRWSYVTDAILTVLVEADPANAETYQANHQAYKTELAALHAWAQESFATIPPDKQKLVTAHDAFQYLSMAYGIEVFAPQGISTEAEASVADIQAAVDYIVANQVPAIFFESAIPIDTVEAMIEGAKARGHDVQLGGELYADTMGAYGTVEGTYLGMIEHNVTTIVEALGGTVSPPQ